MLAESLLILLMGQSNAVGMGENVPEWLQKSGSKVVTCAMPGTSIAKWEPVLDRRTLYGRCMAVGLELAEEYDRVLVVFWQGEADAMRAKDARAWGGRFSSIYRALVTDLGAETVVVELGGQMVGARGYPGWHIVKNAQANVVGVKTVSADGVEYMPDEVHCTPAGYAEMWRRVLAD